MMFQCVRWALFIALDSARAADNDEIKPMLKPAPLLILVSVLLDPKACVLLLFSLANLFVPINKLIGRQLRNTNRLRSTDSLNSFRKETIVFDNIAEIENR